jgi:hypothetical protein
MQFNFDHVTAPASREILDQTFFPTHVQLMRAFSEMSAALEEDVNNEDVPYSAIDARAAALNELELVLSSNNDVYNEAGEYVGNVGVDKAAAVQAILSFWSDGQV